MKRVVWSFALVAVLSSTVIFPQSGRTVQSESDQLATSLARAKSGELDTSDVELIAKARAVQAVPALEAQFVRTTDRQTKLKIASGLVRLGDKDTTYWDYLLGQVVAAIESDLPDAVYDSQEHAKENDVSPEIKRWALAHNVDLNSAVLSATYELPGRVLLLGQTEDQREIPILRRALQSHNSMIVVMAAKSLAQIQDKDSIPLIINACRKAPKGADGAIAEQSLIFFDDPLAQSVVDAYVPKERIKVWREARAQGMKAFGF